MKTLVLANQKGGVGKSAVATLMSHYFAQHGQRVLAIDFDHQGNFSGSMRRSSRVQDAGITADRLLTESVHPETVAQWIEGRAHVSRADVQMFKERLVPVAQGGSTPPPVPVQPDPAAQPGLVTSEAPHPSARSDLPAPAPPTINGAVSQRLARAVALLGEVDGVQVRVLLDAKVEGADCVAVSAVESAKRWEVAASSIVGLRLEVLAIPAG